MAGDLGMVNKIYTDISSIKKIKQGIDYAVDAVKVTLGPLGGNVCLDRKCLEPLSVNEKTECFRNLTINGPLENIGVRMISEIVEKTEKEAGDGGITSAIFAQTMVSEGVKKIVAGASPILIKKGVDLAVDITLEKIDRETRQLQNSVEMKKLIESTLTDLTLSSLVYEALDYIGGCDGIVVERSKTKESHLEKYPGFNFKQGYLSDEMINYFELGQCIYEDVDILLIDKKIVDLEDIYPILKLVVGRKKPLLMIVDGLEGDALKIVNLNNRKGNFSIVAVHAATFGDNRVDEFLDIEALTGGKAITKEIINLNLDNVNESFLGHAERIIVKKDETVIIGGNKDEKKRQSRINNIKSMLNVTESEFALEVYQMRLRKLVGSTVVIQVGTETENEFIEKKKSIEKVLRRSVEIREYGYIVGGGTCYMRAISALKELRDAQDQDDIKMGIQIIEQALQQPLKQLLKNSGKAPERIVEIVRNSEDNRGYNVLTERIEDLKEAGIIEPVIVPKVALINASNLAKMFFSIGAVITG